jgi:hypothetical protein
MTTMRMKHADHGVYYCDSNDGLKTVKSVMSMMVLKTVKSVVSMRAMMITISVISALLLTTVMSMMLHKIWECIVKKYQCNGFFVSASIPANQRLLINVNASILQRISCPLQGTHTTAICSYSNTVCTVHSAPRWFSEYQKKCRLKAEDQVTSVE